MKISVIQIEDDVKRYLEMAKLVKNKVKVNEKKTNLRINNRQLKKTKVSQYKKNEKVLVRAKDKAKRVQRGGKNLKEPRAEEAQILKRKGTGYIVKTKEKKRKWVDVSEVTSLTRNEEKKRPKYITHYD